MSPLTSLCSPIIGEGLWAPRDHLCCLLGFGKVSFGVGRGLFIPVLGPVLLFCFVSGALKSCQLILRGICFLCAVF